MRFYLEARGTGHLADTPKMQRNSTSGIGGSLRPLKTTNVPAQQQTTLPSISHIISGRALGLRTADRLEEDKESSEEGEEETPQVHSEEEQPEAHARRSKRKHSRGRITDRAPKLEDELKQQGEQFKKQQFASREELRQLQMSLESEKSKCSLLEEMLDRERADRLKVEKEVEVLKATSSWISSRAGTESST